MAEIRFGVVGTNFITGWLIAGARHDKRFNLTAVCSREQSTAEAFAKRHNIPFTFTSLEDMAASPLIDAVYIASPNFMHAAQSVLCMSHGKHVLCEKPIASNAKEARVMMEASEKYNVALMEAMKPTLSPNFKVILDNLGKTGKIRRYFASYCQYSSRYDKFKMGYLPNAFNPEYSNGAIMDIGVYTIYPMIVLFGMPDSLTASGSILSSGTDGQGTVMFNYPDMDAIVMYSKIADSQLTTEIQGERGNITIDRINQPGKIYFTPIGINEGGKTQNFKSPELLTADVQSKDPYYYEIKEFIDLITSGKRQSTINSHTNSVNTMILLDEIRRQLGVTFPADNL